jgi:hypothetical protein
MPLVLNNSTTIFVVFMLIAFVPFALLPTIISFRYENPNRVRVAVINLFLLSIGLINSGMILGGNSQSPASQTIEVLKARVHTLQQAKTQLADQLYNSTSNNSTPTTATPTTITGASKSSSYSDGYTIGFSSGGNGTIYAACSQSLMNAQAPSDNYDQWQIGCETGFNDAYGLY